MPVERCEIRRGGNADGGGSEGGGTADFTVLPRAFRALLKDPNDAAIDKFERLLGAFAHASREPCTEEQRLECGRVAAEAAALGSTLAVPSLRRVATVAQATSFIARWLRWTRARERAAELNVDSAAAAVRCLRTNPNPNPNRLPPAPPTWEALLRPAYLPYDTCRFDFRGLLLRIFGDALDEQGSGVSGGSADDPLARLHLTPTGCCERGYARVSALPREELRRKPSPLDEATRYGCGSLNRTFKNSSLHSEFMALYLEFIREWVAPQLGATELLYQSRPIFRVLLPDHLAVGPRHRDATYHAQPNELNFWVPFTDAYDTNSLQVESEPNAGDFEPVTCGYGSVYRFFGNGCEHLTELNEEVVRCPVPEEEEAEDGAAGSSSGGKGADEYFRVGRYYERMTVG